MCVCADVCVLVVDCVCVFFYVRVCFSLRACMFLCIYLQYLHSYSHVIGQHWQTPLFYHLHSLASQGGKMTLAYRNKVVELNQYHSVNYNHRRVVRNRMLLL